VAVASKGLGVTGDTSTLVEYLDGLVGDTHIDTLADSDRYRPPFRFDAAHDSGMIPPTVPG
jgi:hypothetical protein